MSLRRKFPKLILSISSRHYSSKLPVVAPSSELLSTAKPPNPWKEVSDPKGTGLIYYWNPETNETTQLGAPRPSYWVSVPDPKNSGLIYWWNPETNETTPLGAPKPQTLANYNMPFPRTDLYLQNKPSFGRTIGTFMLLGVGMTIGATFVRALFGF